MIVVKEAKFVTSALKLDGCPPPDTTEVAFLGRSNVGKSTLINALLDKKLAKSSSTPGKTQLINFFSTIWEEKVENSKRHFPLFFVDLPGFGYAKVSKQTKKKWEANLWEFLTRRTSLKLFVYLIDSRHTELEIDLYITDILKESLRGDQNILKIYTKFDKLNKNEQNKLCRTNALVASDNDKIVDKKYGGKDTIREKILKGAFGIDMFE